MDIKETFIETIQKNERLIYKIASVYTNNRTDRDDLVQEIIYQLWKSFDSFAHRASVSTWLYRVAMNVAIYQLKKARRTIRTIPMDERFFEVEEAESTQMEEKWRLFRQQLDTLNLLDKGIVILYLENKSYEEIAQIIGISVSNVGTRLSRIREKLKQQLAKHT